MIQNQPDSVKVFLPTNVNNMNQNITQPISNTIQFSNRPTFHPR